MLIMERRFAILMQYGIDRVLRNRAITVAVILLLSVSIVIGNFGWISYMVTCQQVEAIDDAYSTLASPSRSYDVAYDRQSSSWQLTYSSGGHTRLTTSALSQPTNAWSRPKVKAARLAPSFMA